MRKVLALALLMGVSTGLQAASSGKIATLCKKQWPGKKGMQSYCIKEKSNYHDWLQFIRKRIHRNPALLAYMDACQREYAPDYRKASDCYWDEVE